MEPFCSWTNFSEKGIAPEDISLSFPSFPECPVPSEAHSTFDVVLEEISDGWFKAVNLESGHDRQLDVTPISFEFYLARQKLLKSEEDRTDYEISADTVETLRRNIRILSSFVGITTEDHLLLGLRPKGWRGPHPSISAPGGGYLEFNQDFSSHPDYLPTTAILREITEEVGITQEQVTNIRSFGVYEETAANSDQNPAIFSQVSLKASRKEVESAWRQANDSDEFDKLLWLPLEPEILDTVLSAATNASPVPEILAGQVNLQTLQWQFTPKTILLFYLIGRARFGKTAAPDFAKYVTFE